MSTTIAQTSASFVSGTYNPRSMFVPTNQPMHCKFINTTIPGDWMKYVIGNNGHYFNAITYQSKCSYIWFHKDNAMIEIWGSTEDAIADAERRIKDRMDYICVQVLTNNGLMKNGKPVTKVMWADIVDDM
jgi:polyribonucleotide nucleotidyltransferase